MTNSPEEFSDNNKLHLDSLPTSPEDSSSAGTSKNLINNDNNNENNTNSVNASKSSSKKKEKKEKKEKNKPINFANGISISVPLTGERPKPLGDKPSMDDDVLLAIFIILYENDPTSSGMTVKQICDILVEKHPEMSKISSKTSNLVSAKLNAYVKKVEKGEKSIHYSLSRDWADSSPKRMVYVYRGVLASDYPDFVHRVIEKHRLEESNRKLSPDQPSSSAGDSRSTPSNGDEFGISPSGLHLRNDSPFSDSLDFSIPQLSIPYAVAPVTASLTNGDYPMKGNNHQYLTVHNENSTNDDDDDDDDENNDNENDEAEDDDDEDDDDDDEDDEALRPGFDDDDSESDSEEENGIYKNHGYSRRGSEIVTEKIPYGIGKRSKSMSFIHKRPKTSHLTTASMTPRIPRKKSIANSANAASAVAALRVAALNTFNISMTESVNSITTSIMSDTSVEPSISVKWLETVRSGFFNQDIESPENVSLAELETMFT